MKKILLKQLRNIRAHARAGAIVLGVVLALTLCFVNLYAAPVTVGNFVVDYVNSSDWGSGATINVTLTNNGPAVQSWTVGWTFPGNQTITNIWNATYTQSGAAVTVKNADFNGSLSTGGSTSFGFNLNYSGTNAAPTSFTVNSSSTTTPTPTRATTPTPTVRAGTPTPTRSGVTPSVTRGGTATPTPTGIRATPTSIPASVYKFDFGGGAVQSGYTKVSASLAYNASLGYGFNTPSNMKNVSSSGTGINADAVQFLAIGTTSSNTFNVNLPMGLYQIKVILGNCSRSSVAAEGVYQIMNMTGNNAVDTIQIPITDGQLNLLITDGMVGAAHTLSALEITRLSTNPTMNKTIWIGGDSTVCNYYPLSNTDNSVQTGWGQMMSSYISSSRYQIRNMATGGQYARGFLNDGQFTAIMKYLKAGDIFILQFGINDTASKNAETADQFTQYMGTMVDQAKAAGATVVLNTPQGRASNWSGTTHTCLNSSYRPQTVALASAKNVPLCDLNVLSSAYFTSIGQTATYALYMADYLHLNRAGALQLARIEYDELTRQNLLK